jgi:hypothetical protein
MSETNQDSVPDTKKTFRNFATGYAILVPAVSLICILSLMEVKISLYVPPWVAASIFISSFVMGLLSLFSRSVGVGIRALVFVGMLVNAVLGGLALLVCYLNSVLRC